MIGGSWTHLLARQAVRPLLGTPVRPNHLTTLRLGFGLAACLGFAWGSAAGMSWGGTLWLVSAFLDRADGELARIGNLSSPGGHLYDYWVDNLVNAAFFAAIGLGLRGGWLGPWSIGLGLLAAAGLLACNWTSERLERLSPPNTRAYAGRWGFDPDDALYLMAPAAWLGWLAPVLIGAAAATPVIAAITLLRLIALQRAQGVGAAR